MEPPAGSGILREGCVPSIPIGNANAQRHPSIHIVIDPRMALGFKRCPAGCCCAGVVSGVGLCAVRSGCGVWVWPCPVAVRALWGGAPVRCGHRLCQF